VAAEQGHAAEHAVVVADQLVVVVVAAGVARIEREARDLVETHGAHEVLAHARRTAGRDAAAALDAAVELVDPVGKLGIHRRLDAAQVRVLLERVHPGLEPLAHAAHPLAGIHRQVGDQLERGQRRERDVLRQVLLAKRAEIVRLRQSYQYGVLELEEEIARFIKRTGMDGLVQALKEKPVEFNLDSIQRRQAYADGLEKPLRWIDAAGEDLLYLQRRAFYDLQVRQAASGVGMDAHQREIDAALRNYQPTTENLAVSTAAALQPLEPMWKRLVEKSRQVVLTGAESRNHDIVDEICSGNLGRVPELSVLTLRSARCLAESQAKELFLNRLTDMPAAAGQKLVEWPGTWLCLNGFTRLAPETAQHLFAWSGDWISLNGIGELTADAARYLPAWKGRKLELMSLQKTNGIEYLAQWEASGGRLFVPAGIRQEIVAWRQSTRPVTPLRKGGA